MPMPGNHIAYYTVLIFLIVEGRSMLIAAKISHFFYSYISFEFIGIWKVIIAKAKRIRVLYCSKNYHNGINGSMSFFMILCFVFQKCVLTTLV